MFDNCKFIIIPRYLQNNKTIINIVDACKKIKYTNGTVYVAKFINFVESNLTKG